MSVTNERVEEIRHAYNTHLADPEFQAIEGNLVTTMASHIRDLLAALDAAESRAALAAEKDAERFRALEAATLDGRLEWRTDTGLLASNVHVRHEPNFSRTIFAAPSGYVLRKAADFLLAEEKKEKP